MDAYIIGGYRSAVAKAPRGGFRFLRADDLGEQVIRRLMSDFPQLDKERIDDVIVGNATPEAEQGLNLGRMVSLMGLDTEKVPGMTVNRYCASGLETIAIASAKIHAGIADCIIAGGIETMTPIPFGGWRIVPNARVAKTNPEWYWGMGLTAEAVAKEFNISREDQDAFAVESHARAAAAIDSGAFASGIAPITVNEVFLDEHERRQERQHVIDTDEGVRRGTNPEALAKLRPVFAEGGSVTAGNSSQTSDGAAFVMVVSERMLKGARRRTPRAVEVLSREWPRTAHHGCRPHLRCARSPEKSRTHEGGHRTVRTERSVREPKRGRASRTRTRPFHGQRPRRRHCPRTPPRLHRSQAHRAASQRTENPKRQARHRHDVRGHRTRCCRCI